MLNIIFVGTGGWISTPYRSYQCIFIDDTKDLLVVDCGAFDQGKYSIYKEYLSRIKGIVITHIHGDHIYGLPSLLFYMKFLGVTNKILLLTPVEYVTYISEMIQPVIKNAPYTLEIKGVKGDETININDFNLEFIDVDHTISNLGCKVKVSNRNIGYTSDSRFCKGLEEIAEGSDVLICEASFPSNMRDKAKEVGHLTPIEGVNLAKGYDIDTIIFTHIGFDVSVEKDILLKDLGLRIIWASDNMVVTL